MNLSDWLFFVWGYVVIERDREFTWCLLEFEYFICFSKVLLGGVDFFFVREFLWFGYCMSRVGFF